MGNRFSDLPNFDINIKSDCCNAAKKDECDGDMVRARRASWFDRHRKTSKKNEKAEKGDGDVAAKTTSVQSQSTDEKEVPNSLIPDGGPE